MTRLAIALALLVACGGHAKAPTKPAGEPILAKKIALSFGISPDGEMAEVYLETTDERGSQVSHEVGRYKGPCTKIVAAKQMNALIAVSCKSGGVGTELHAIAQGGDEVVVLRMAVRDGETPDPMAREMVTTVKVPLGVAIEVAK